MNFTIDLLSKNVLFKNIPNEKILSIINSSACSIKTFNPKENIYEVGEEIHSTGIILDGTVDILQISIAGDEIIVDRLTQGDSFGNAFSCVSDINNLNYIRSDEYSTILFINIFKLLRECNFICEYRLCLFENIIHSLAENNIILNTKIQIMSQKTLRNKLITYFELLSLQKGSNEITIPFNREQLACYLGSERSSICRELTKLKEDNIIDINRNNVILLSQDI
ncbi:Crp/Fnr family transcriptional regulator [Clostridium sp. AL.422]|uniref:Crp/Fnr family transcriptional regulator n=1 Tax=Clostridium TaxID=1485 RepID=UPI00293DF290|nr:MULTISPECIES: Crp/Fnr family transcriptional regulator [unclassified Clostridium]MDV4151817.1 Crp/Fnr family transcriptional regulator [Clostridium sp. AL.422]